MKENQNSDNHTENMNSYNYNPNRPQNDSNEHADTKKVVDTAAKGASEFFAPGVGGMVYDAAKKAPVVGDAIDKTADKVAEVADQVPGVKQVTKGLNDSGITDVANQALDFVGSKGLNAGANTAKSAGNITENTAKAGNQVKNASEAGKRVASNGVNAQTQAEPNMPVRKNRQIQNLLNSTDDEEDTMADDELENSEDQPEVDASNTPPPTDLPIEDSSNDDDNQNKDGKGQSDVVGSLFKNIWNKYKIWIILGGGGVALFILFIMVIIGGGVGEYTQSMGYYDELCNYNETRVTLTNCYQNNSEKTELGTYSLEDFVVHMAYAYTKNGDYSEEAIKALMIVLKTNALSYGNYNSSNKNVEVRICDMFHDYENTDSEQELWMFEGIDGKADSLSNLYQEISNYLYVSSSYRSTISNLSSQNVLEINSNTLQEFETLASDGNAYSQILSSVYGTKDDSTSDDEDIVYRETLFLGDSRTRGMQNAGVINERNTIYGVGLGYEWLAGNGTFDNTNSSSGGIHGINNLMRDNTSYNIVIWLGVNDLGNVESYYQRYYDLAVGDWRNHNIYIVSVGPVDDDLSQYAKNEYINNFNYTMSNLIQNSGLNNLFYLDLGYTEDSIVQYDSEGIHYSNEDYRNIYEIIMNNLDSSLNSGYQLYNLTTYCTYYTVTQNTAYWWPVGSRDATQGNIYGGDPTSTIVTSEFGRRNTGIEGASTNHKGIDIAKNGSACGDVVIASRSGTVVTATDDGGARGTYVVIDHGDGVKTLYQHMQQGSYTVQVGDTVQQGQMIGLIGNTGVGSGCHLHFEVIVNEVEVDPLDYVDPENPRPISSSDISTIIAGDQGDNQNMVCMTLLNSGFSENATAGMMVNLYAESGFSPINLQNSYENSLGYTDSSYTSAVDNGSYRNFVHDAAGYGLAQWTYYSRKQNLLDYARTKNSSIGDLGMQLEFFIDELRGYTTTYKYVTGNYSAQDISTYFCLEYENPANASSHCPQRTNNYINQMLTYVKNGCR